MNNIGQQKKFPPSVYLNIYRKNFIEKMKKLVSLPESFSDKSRYTFFYSDSEKTWGMCVFQGKASDEDYDKRSWTCAGDSLMPAGKYSDVSEISGQDFRDIEEIYMQLRPTIKIVKA